MSRLLAGRVLSLRRCTRTTRLRSLSRRCGAWSTAEVKTESRCTAMEVRSRSLEPWLSDVEMSLTAWG